MKNNSYVYAWIDNKKTIFYIGMSENYKNAERAKRDVTEISKPSKAEEYAKQILKNGKKYKITIIKKGMSVVDAILLEMQWIKAIGRKDKGLGTLLNQTDGGECPTSFKPLKYYDRTTARKMLE